MSIFIILLEMKMLVVKPTDDRYYPSFIEKSSDKPLKRELQ